jgi:hypothetical protein
MPAQACNIAVVHMPCGEGRRVATQVSHVGAMKLEQMLTEG